MKCGLRFTLCLVATGFITAILLWKYISDFADQYGAVDYLENSLRHMVWEQIDQPTPTGSRQADKVIVMAKLEVEDTQWVADELPDWQRAIYTVDSVSRSSGTLTTPVNKGHESMAYLTYIIEHYTTLPATIAFLHSHRNGFFEAWHVDTPMHDNVAAMRALQLDYVQKNGYVNLRCNWNPGCLPGHRQNSHVTRAVWQEVFNGTSTVGTGEAYDAVVEPTSRMEDREKARLMPMEVGAACCAQFAVSREQVLQRPLEDYVMMRSWIFDTAKDDAHSGRVMEFLWHVIFGRDAVYCPAEEACYCQVYGRC